MENVRMWNNGVEIDEVTMDQIGKISRLPILGGPLAIMPDAHLGKGSTVGSVIFTRQAVIPASVGVDIGCFVGSTEIPLIGGPTKTLLELAKETEPFWVYSMDKDFRTRRGRATAKMTRSNACLVEVTLSDGIKITCTPDHLFMLSDGSYKEVNDLKFNEDLMTMFGHRVSVLSVESLTEKEDVYCLTVEDYHNFLLYAGVFVHNCGMAAIPLNIKDADLPDNLHEIRTEIESRIPVGSNGYVSIPTLRGNFILEKERNRLINAFDNISLKAKITKHMPEVWKQCGTLGGGNHFIELCVDELHDVWLMLHSGSRGIGNKLAQVAIERAKEIMIDQHIFLEDKELAWLDEGSPDFDEYINALLWSQDYAALNRKIMAERILEALKHTPLKNKNVSITEGTVISCHHNYTMRETHNGISGWLTRKGAVRAGKGEMGIIPGSMGTKSYIVKGKGNPDSYESCSHGAGRLFSRGEAKKRFTLSDIENETSGVECRKDIGILDEIPSAYKDINAVINAQTDLIEVVHTLKQILCVKG